jgi:exodeoxyribonuclease V alpha subunit
MIIALSHIAAREQWLLETIREMAAHTMPPGGMVNDIGNDQLNAEQQQAVGRALRAPISCVTGPAGSGKTFAISHACTCFENAGLSIALAAPTGKAARRLSESSGRTAGTIHRLLMHDGVGFQFNAETQLDYDVIIVDEVSMMDINLAWNLFRAIDARCTRVILVGDHNQLPPVGPGNLLRDIITHEIIPVSKLKTIIRQAGKLQENSNLVLGGVAAKTSKPEWYVFNGWPGAPASKFQDAEDRKSVG